MICPQNLFKNWVFKSSFLLLIYLLRPLLLLTSYKSNINLAYFPSNFNNTIQCLKLNNIYVPSVLKYHTLKYLYLYFLIFSNFLECSSCTYHHLNRIWQFCFSDLSLSWWNYIIRQCAWGVAAKRTDTESGRIQSWILILSLSYVGVCKSV